MPMKRLNVMNGTQGALLGEAVSLADGYWTRLRGLLGRPEPREGEGLLIAPSRGVHMYGMRYALDIVMIARDRTVVALYPGLAPGRRSKVHKDASFALELPVGTIERTGTEVGDSIEWRPADEPVATTGSRGY